MKKTAFALAIALLFGVASGTARADMLYYLPFDNGTSATLANDGTVGGTATAVRAGDGGGSIPASSTDVYANLGGSHSENFPMAPGNISGGRVVLPDSTDKFRLTTSGQQMTISTWIKWNGADGNVDARQGIVSTLPGAMNTGWGFSVLSNGKLRFSWGGIGDRTSTSATVVPVGSWTHVAVTYTAGGSPTFYINGANVGLDQAISVVAVTNSQAIRLGNLDGTYLPVNGRLDDVALWNANLGAGKARSLFTVPAFLSGYDAGDLDTLFQLYDADDPAPTLQIGDLTWRYATSLTGHVNGDVWTDAKGRVYVQFETGKGVIGSPPPVGTTILIR